MKQLITYFGLAYLISWIIWLPLYGSAFGLTNLPVLPFHHGIGGLGPLIASFLTTWIYQKQPGVKQLLNKCLQVKPLLYLMIALLSPFLLALIVSVISYFVGKVPVEWNKLFSSREFPDFSLLTFFLYNLLFFGFGEEVGWRGFALPRIQRHFNALNSSMILTFFWALWHWPLFLYRPGYTSMDAAAIFGWVMSLLTGSVLLTWLFNSSRGSLLICAVFHATIDIAFMADFADKNSMNYLGFLVTVWGILTIVFFKPANLSVRERITQL
jgi:membrane protease YdiL (CAAX protease family)